MEIVTKPRDKEATKTKAANLSMWPAFIVRFAARCPLTSHLIKEFLEWISNSEQN
jgi:hypothetical protein